MLEPITTLMLFHYGLVFCRVGAAVMLFPGIGEIYVSPRVRLTLAFFVTIILTPILQANLPAPGNGIVNTTLIILSEIVIGLYIGMLTRMIQAVLHVAGMIIAFQSSLASALLFDANQGSQGSVVGNFMTVVGVTLLFTTELHHMLLQGAAQSYQVFPVAQGLPFGDAAHYGTQVLSGGFKIAFRIASPLIVVGLLIYLAAGIMGRLMPSMQVFFVLVPLQLYVGFLLLMLSLSAAMTWYLEFFRQTMAILF